MFGIVTRKTRHFQLYTAIVSQQLAQNEGIPQGCGAWLESEVREEAWSQARRALQTWESLNRTQR
jgi:hypothetical protein